jgi:hypothetical protein
MFAFVAGVLAGHRLGAWGIVSRIEEVVSREELRDLNRRIKERFG